MAIKGKSRSKSKPRAGARAPRPVPVVVQPPFFLRRKVQVSLAFLVGIATMVVFIWATDGIRQEREKHTAAAAAVTARAAVASWQASVNAALGAVQFDTQTRSLGAMTQLTALLGQIGKAGKIPSGASDQAAASETSFKTAADGLEKLSTDVIRSKGLNEFEAGSLIDSRVALIQVLRTGEEVAGLVQIAAGTDPATAKAIAARGTVLITSAQSTFSSAYESFFEITVEVGLSSGLPPPPTGSSGS